MRIENWKGIELGLGYGVEVLAEVGTGDEIEYKVEPGPGPGPEPAPEPEPEHGPGPGLGQHLAWASLLRIVFHFAVHLFKLRFLSLDLELEPLLPIQLTARRSLLHSASYKQLQVGGKFYVRKNVLAPLM